jgi:hypothetical protein
VGKRTLTEQLVQRLEKTGASAGGDVHAAAAHGTSGAPTALPHIEQIQRSFGSHDVSHVQAHVGGLAAEGARAMGAQAYATGDRVAFASAPDLHTAAHEAAHVVQQKGGMQLKEASARAAIPTSATLTRSPTASCRASPPSRCSTRWPA